MPVRAPYPVHDSSYELIDYIERRMLFAKHQPLWLGGEIGSPGSVMPPGGYIGFLPQNRVQYDPIEAESASGGSTLMDNLAHDRHRLTTYMKQVAHPNSQGSTISAGSYPSWGSGAWIVGFSPGSPPSAPTVQDAIQYIWNETGSTGNYWTWHTFMFSVEGQVEESTGELQIAVPGTFTIDHVYLRCQTAPTGNDLIVDVNKNDVTIFTTQGNRPQVNAGANSGTSGTPDITALTLNDYLTFDVDQIGSTVPGSNLTVHVRCKQYMQL